MFTPKEEDFFWVMACRLAPGCGGLAAGERTRVLAIIREAIGSRPISMRRQFKIFLAVIRLAGYFSGGSFERLRPDKQDAILRWFQDSPIPLLRKGFWGLKTLTYMGYYGRPEIGPSLHYQPSKNGNELLEKERV